MRALPRAEPEWFSRGKVTLLGLGWKHEVMEGGRKVFLAKGKAIFPPFLWCFVHGGQLLGYAKVLHNFRWYMQV